jgi:hypothetical protein
MLEGTVVPLSDVLSGIGLSRKKEKSHISPDTQAAGDN